MEEYTHPVVSLIIQHNIETGKILLQERLKPDINNIIFYELPQGRIRENELILDAARRELFEETGLVNFQPSTIINGSFIDKSNYQCLTSFIVSFSGPNSYLAICIIGKAEGELKASIEAKNHMWVGRDEITNFIMNNKIFPLNIPMLKNYFNL